MSAENTPLAAWLQARLGALYEVHAAPDEAAFVAQFDTVFARDAKVMLNHVPSPRTAYLAKLRGEHFAAVRESVEWRELIEVLPADGAPGTTGGVVAGFFIGTRSMKFRIRAGPAQQLSYNSFSARIEEKADVEPSAEDGSRLRITELFITSVHKAAPIHISPIPGRHE
ncbi:hypothetical protein HYPSUDRAFT_60084 [Hypholoma sublateritium FD-334 SS-4]|uniref:SnoaL-like domain-containing protein n=1 Tax=Hypholoma sublateritium (strain FD-334 SS-4) TaxID=945553 RepID=A0A0D2N8S9_HYPSF|nr:hypothetical protein HYPSUDRAFT_60084 [Hypholoma sublateritium FD-334 SS-4]